MNGLPKTAAGWKRLQPSSLRHALELCKEHARAIHNRSVERIAELMGQADHWSVYKWISSGRLPLVLVRPFEAACGIDYVTRWLAASNGKLLVDIPTGRTCTQQDAVELNTGFAQALQLLTDFYARPAAGNADEVIQSLTAHLQAVAWHRANVAKTAEPELELA